MQKYHAADALEVKLDNGRLVISVGIGIMAHAIQAAEQSSPWPEDWYIESPRGFAADIVRELLREEEDGTTPVHRMLDKAAESALEAGSLSCEEGSVELGIKIASELIEKARKER